MNRMLLALAALLTFHSISLKAQTTTITVGGATPTYTRLALAFNAISLGTHTGVVHVQLAGLITETSKASLTQNPLVDSVLIYPVASCTLQGNINDDLIDMNGAGKVWFDGRINRQGAASSLTVSNNSNASLAYAYCYRNTARFNAIRYVAAKCSGKGVIRFSNSSTGAGNSDNVIEYCAVSGGTATPENGIYSDGQFGALNARNIVRYCSIFDCFSTTYFSNGIFLRDYNQEWQITGNSFYQTAARSSSYLYTAVKVVANNQSYLYRNEVKDNFIGGSAPQCAGSPYTITGFIGIDITAASNTLSIVQNNRISNMVLSGFFIGIQTGYGKILVKNNFVGDSAGVNRVVLTSSTAVNFGIHAAQNDSIKVFNNYVGAITSSCTVSGIDVYGFMSSLSAVTVTGNVIGSRVTPNSIVASGTTAILVTGIKHGTTNGIVNNNVVMNITATSTTGANCSINGIVNGSGYTSGNEVAFLKCLNISTNFASCNGISTFEAKNNFVHHLEAYTDYHGIVGISAYTAVNNIVALGFGISSAAQIIGIYANNGVNAGYYQNTVALGGTRTGTAMCACISGGTSINSNVFYCARTSTVASLFGNYCVFGGGSAAANCFYASGSGNSVAWSGGITYGNWGTGGYTGNPYLGNVGSTLPISYKPGITLGGTNSYGGFVSSVPSDYFGFSRPNPPTMGAIERTSCVQIPYTKNVNTCGTYSLNGQSYSVSGVYSQTVITPGDCDTLLTINLLVGVAPLSFSTAIVSSCAGQSNTITAAGAASYTWLTVSSPTTDAISVSPTVTTVYSVSVVNLAGCSATFSYQLNVKPLPVVALSGTQLCAGQSYTLFPAGASTYTFVNGGPVVSPSTTITYTVLGAGANGCTAQAMAQVTVSPNPTVAVNSGSVCLGSNYTLTPSGASSYLFPTGGPVLTPTASSVYLVTGTDVNGCVASVVATVAVVLLPTVSVPSGTLCAGQTFTLQPSGGSTYIFLNGGPAVNPLSTTVFSVNSVNGFGCISASSATAQVTVMPSPTAALNSGSICAGSGFTLQPTGGATYVYLNGGPVVMPSATSIYSVSAVGSNGCISSVPAVAMVTVFPLPSLLVTAASTVVCFGETPVLTASGADAYNWFSGAMSPTIQVFPNLGLTVFTVTGINAASGCAAVGFFPLQVDACDQLRETAGPSFKVFPNPASGTFRVESSSAGIVEITDVTGRLVSKAAMVPGLNYFETSASFAGMLFVTVHIPGSSPVTIRLVCVQ